MESQGEVRALQLARGALEGVAEALSSMSRDFAVATDSYRALASAGATWKTLVHGEGTRARE